ncbi:Hypothetical predicted protein [Mytilus galloprovincialis]|uniref:Uncharacterized protein n=1 Tax=Mytilus galloprovincialis TaxID=29158 RepID=A0A8B6CQU4_MYTGA|nr:Hypothetical predicted protein [Mytilus galloprovincialis]
MNRKATTGIKFKVSSENISPTEFFSTESIISTEKTTFDAMTSTSVETSMNPDDTKKAPHTTDVKRTTKEIKTSLLVPATTKEASLISTENLSTISVHQNISQTTLPTKKTRDRPINPAVIVVALTSSLTFLIVIVGFFLRRYTKSRLDRTH